MKKLYTLTFLLLPLLMQAQTLSLTVDGEQVENGSTFTKTYTSDEHDLFPNDEALSGQYFEYGLYPNVYFTTSIAQEVTVYCENMSRTDGVQCCFGEACRTLNEAVNYRMNETVSLNANSPSDMRIHAKTESHGTEAYTVRLDLSFQAQNGDTFSCTLELSYDPDANAIQSVPVGNSKTIIYNLTGQRLSAPQKGVNIRDGKKVLVR